MSQCKGVTVPVPLDGSTGAVAVKKASGKTRVRKGQDREAFVAQRDLFWSRQEQALVSGRDVNWMDGYVPGEEEEEGADAAAPASAAAMAAGEAFDPAVKHCRQQLVDYVARLFYQRRYRACHTALVETLLPLLEALASGASQQEQEQKKKKPRGANLDKEIDALRFMATQCEAQLVRDLRL